MLNDELEPAMPDRTLRRRRVEVTGFDQHKLGWSSGDCLSSPEARNTMVAWIKIYYPVPQDAILVGVYRILTADAMAFVFQHETFSPLEPDGFGQSPLLLKKEEETDWAALDLASDLGVDKP